MTESIQVLQLIKLSTQTHVAISENKNKQNKLKTIAVTGLKVIKNKYELQVYFILNKKMLATH